MLNSKMVIEYVKSHNISIQMGDIFKHMNLPQFDVNNQKHLAIARLTKKAHTENDEKKRKIINDLISVKSEELINKSLSVSDTKNK